MFDKNRKYNLSKAGQNRSTDQADRHYSQHNAHVNAAFNRSTEDDLDKPHSPDISLDTEQLARPQTKHDELDLERATSIFQERRSVIPELETVIKWDNLELEVNAKGKMKKILDNVSGEVNNLEIMAILGPSGAGKSTLLNTIAGRVKNSEYKGSVNFYSKDKCITFAYVPQVDQLSSYLTVKESLLFSSKLRNPSYTNHAEEVEYVLTAFNLWKAKNHYAFRCSGGERKRLSIGLEMISKPKILILDEPTSGLDSTTSYIVIEVLKVGFLFLAIITLCLKFLLIPSRISTKTPPSLQLFTSRTRICFSCSTKPIF